MLNKLSFTLLIILLLISCKIKHLNLFVKNQDDQLQRIVVIYKYQKKYLDEMIDIYQYQIQLCEKLINKYYIEFINKFSITTDSIEERTKEINNLLKEYELIQLLSKELANKENDFLIQIDNPIYKNDADNNNEFGEDYTVSSNKIHVELNYEKIAFDVFKGKILASGLRPNHEYLLTLNGWANHESNKLLIKQCKIWEPTGEGYCDFKIVTTDSKGSISKDIEKLLDKGLYKVKLLIKDTSNWTVVWSDDTLKFKVK